jgi:pyruvate/2-oxoglutarate dehydrogenase complex dihydrolipoamide dehydrogenase (E3) component
MAVESISDLAPRCWPLLVVGGGPAAALQVMAWRGDTRDVLVVSDQWGGGMAFMGDSELQSYRHELLIPGAPEHLSRLLPESRLRPSASQYSAYVKACLRASGARLGQARVEDVTPANADAGDDCVVQARADDGTVARLRAETVVMATGSRPKPPPPRMVAAGAIRYDEIFRMGAAPRARLCRDRSVVIVGSGNSALQTAALVARTARDTLILANRYHGLFPIETDDRFAWRGRSSLTCELIAKSAMACRTGGMSGICVRLLVYRDLELTAEHSPRLHFTYLDTDNKARRLTRYSLPGRCEHAQAQRVEGGWAEERDADTLLVWAAGSEPVYPPSPTLAALARKSDGQIDIDADGRTRWGSVYAAGACRGHRSVNEMTPAVPVSPADLARAR